MIDALADTRRRAQRRKGRIRVYIYIYSIYIFSMRYRLETQQQIYIKVITTIRHTGKACTHGSETRIYRDLVGVYIYIRAAFLYSIALHRDGFLMGCEQQKSGLVKLGICPRYTNPRTFIKERNRFCLVKFIRDRADEGN